MSRMKFLVLCLFVMLMALTPLFLFQNFVMPELKTLDQAYRSSDETAAQVVARP